MKRKSSIGGKMRRKISSVILLAGGFSLVEVLVTVAIAAIAVALLVAGTGRWIKAGEGTKCLANLKSISLGVNGYLADHNGVFPSAQLPEPEVLWFHAIRPYVDGLSAQPQSLDHPHWLQCPGKRFPAAFRTHVGYGWNYLGFGDEVWDANGKTRLLDIERPSDTILAGDSPDLGDIGPNWWMNVYIYGEIGLLAERHAGCGNYLFVDGHSEALRPQQLGEKLPGIYLPRKNPVEN